MTLLSHVLLHYFSVRRQALNLHVMEEAVPKTPSPCVNAPNSRWRSGDLIAARVAAGQNQQDE